MDIKEIGIAGFVVIGGAVYGISEYGYSDVLKEDLKAVSEVSIDERETYMESVAVQFTEFYEGALYGTDNFTFAGDLNYELDPDRPAFIEVTTSHTQITPEEVKDLKSYNADKWMCQTEDTLLFTDKGWTYTTKLKNLDGRTMVIITCNPDQNDEGLRVG